MAAVCVVTPRCYWMFNDLQNEDDFCWNSTLATTKAAGRT